MASVQVIDLAGKVGVGETIKIHPMTDHYAVTIGDNETVAVVCRSGETSWGIETISGRVDNPYKYVPLADALKTAMTWRR